MAVPEQMLKIMTAEITQSLCSLVALKGPAGSDRRMKQNELIFHQQQQPFITPHEHASAILGTAAASVSIGEGMAVMRGWRSESDAASLSVLSTPAASDEPHTSPKPGRVSGSGRRGEGRRGRQLRQRGNLHSCLRACLRTCPLQCCRLDCVINFIQLTVNYC